MEPYIKRLPKLVKITVDVLKDIKYLKKAVNVKQSQNIPAINKVISNIKYIEKLPKLTKITGNILNDVKRLEEEVNEMQSTNIASNSKMLGNGQVDINRINEISDDIDDLYLNINELDGFLKKKSGGIDYLEKVFDNTLQIIELFKNKMYSEIKYKIKELRNAALLALNIFKKTKQLGKDKEDLLQELINASIFEGKDLLNDNIESLRTIFLYLPEEELMEAIKEIKESELSDTDDNNNADSDQNEYEDAEEHIVQRLSDTDDNNNVDSDQNEYEDAEEHIVQSDVDRESLRDQESNVSEGEEIKSMEDESSMYRDIDTENENNSLTDQKSDISVDEESMVTEEDVKTETEKELLDTENYDKDLVENSDS